MGDWSSELFKMDREISVRTEKEKNQDVNLFLVFHVAI